jgi:MoxR-like ATPase
MSTATEAGDITKFDAVRNEVSRVIVGQQELVERLIMALLCRGHVLIEGVPGLAKTLTVSTLAQTLGVTFRRIQFTPDLMPGDLIGTLVYNPQTGAFTPHRGPVFGNVILADEINRSPAKVQSALLEAMQERQVTIGSDMHKLDDPFLVLATQNPIEQEGTYPLPEAQLDRFMFKLRVDYPSMDEEHEVLRRMSRNEPQLDVETVLSADDLRACRPLLDDIHVSELIERYILLLVAETRSKKGELAPYLQVGASPRATINLAKAARARALLAGRDHVIPEDVKVMAPDVMRHRIVVSYRAEAENRDADAIITRVLETVDVP